MAVNPMVRIHDLATGEIIDRPMTAAEKADYDALIAVRELEMNQRS
jgi:hypothetical protein